jgi:hypothetical protein
MVYGAAVRAICCVLLLAGGCAAQQPNAAELTNRVIEKARQRGARLPNYTCVETVTRDYYRPVASTLPRSCPVLAELRQHRTPDMELKWIWTDRLRLDVAMTERGEIHSWVGASKFEDGDIDHVVTSGPIGTGAFGGFLAMIFAGGADSIRYLGERDGLHEFSFRLEKTASNYRVKVGDGWVIVGCDGVFQVDPGTLDLVRMRVRVADMPDASGDCETTTTIELGLARIGDGEFLLPKLTRQRFVTVNGEEAENTTTFSACREYRGNSTITFYAEPVAEGGGESQNPAAQLEVPPGIWFTLELTVPIDPTTVAAGDPFTGRLVHALRDGKGKVVAPSHAVVHGRVLRVENLHAAPAGSVVVLRPRSVESGGRTLLLHARRDWSKVQGKVALALPLVGEENAAVFLLRGKAEKMPAGLRSDWVTVRK